MRGWSGYDEKLEFVPDLLESFENVGDRDFTFSLRPGHRWSDGHPFTTEDFRYFWEDVANNKDAVAARPAQRAARERQGAARSPSPTS